MRAKALSRKGFFLFYQRLNFSLLSAKCISLRLSAFGREELHAKALSRQDFFLFYSRL